MIGLSLLVISMIFTLAWLKHGGIDYIREKLRNEKR